MQPRFHEFNAPDLMGEGSHRIAFVEWGESDNPKILLCVHGLTRNSRDFDFLAEELSEHYRVICPDMAGRGRSAWLDDPMQYNYVTYIADCLALLDHLDSKQVDWVGTSMGGLIGMTIAAQQPERIHKLVLNDIGPHIPAKSLERIKRYVGVHPKFKTPQDVEDHLRVILAPFGIREDDHWRHMAEHSAMVHENGKLALAYDPTIVNAFETNNGDNISQDIELWELWDTILHNTLILRGAESDVLTADTANRMHNAGAEKHLVEFSGVGHAPALMEAAQIAVIQKWLIDA